MKKIHIQTGLMLLLFSGLMLACRLSTPDPTATVPMDTATATSSLIPSLTMTPAPTATPTITPTPTHTPTPANPISHWEPYHFLPDYDEPNAGEYILLYHDNLPDKIEDGIMFSYVSWDLQQHDTYFSLEFVDAISTCPFLTIENVVECGRHSRIMSGYYAFNPPSKEEYFFGHNCVSRDVFPRKVRPGLLLLSL